MIEGILRRYLWWSLRTLYLHASWVRVPIGDSGLCCYTCVTYFERRSTPLLVDSAQALWASFCFRFVDDDFDVKKERKKERKTNSCQSQVAFWLLYTDIWASQWQAQKHASDARANMNTLFFCLGVPLLGWGGWKANSRNHYPCRFFKCWHKIVVADDDAVDVCKILSPP